MANSRCPSSRREIFSVLSRWIGIDSVCTRSNHSFAREVERHLKKGGFKTFLQKVRRGNTSFYNVAAFKGTKGRKRPLLICSHLDTVPEGNPRLWTKTSCDPWKATMRGDTCYGLGSADDKGPLLAMTLAGCAVQAHDLKRPLIVLATFGEENGMRGAAHFVKSWERQPFLRPELVIAGEPTELGITYRHKGVGVLQIELIPNQKIPVTAQKKKFFKGKSGHSSRPASGINALEKAMEYLNRNLDLVPSVCHFQGGAAANIIPGECVLGFNRTQPNSFPMEQIMDCWKTVQKVIQPLQKKRDSLIHPSYLTSNFGTIETKGGITALLFDFRLLPGQSIIRIHQHVAASLKKQWKGKHRVKWKVVIERDNPPLGLQKNDKLVQISKRAIQRSNISPHLLTKPACTEAGTYQKAGVPAVVIGPGKAYGNIHAPNESICISEIRKAIRVYTNLIEEVCVK